MIAFVAGAIPNWILNRRWTWKVEGQVAFGREILAYIVISGSTLLALSLAAAPMHLLALIKPQFEAARKHSKRGIIRNAMVHQEICDDIAGFVASLGCTGIQVFPSSITGGDGNIEFFIGARRG